MVAVSDAWDDSVLLRACNAAVKKYISMHSGSKKATDDAAVEAAALDSVSAVQSRQGASSVAEDSSGVGGVAICESSVAVNETKGSSGAVPSPVDGPAPAASETSAPGEPGTSAPAGTGPKGPPCDSQHEGMAGHELGSLPAHAVQQHISSREGNVPHIPANGGSPAHEVVEQKASPAGSISRDDIPVAGLRSDDNGKVEAAWDPLASVAAVSKASDATILSEGTLRTAGQTQSFQEQCKDEHVNPGSPRFDNRQGDGETEAICSTYNTYQNLLIPPRSPPSAPPLYDPPPSSTAYSACQLGASASSHATYRLQSSTSDPSSAAEVQLASGAWSSPQGGDQN
ncbi:hypothetical protein CBR_g12794 [Chara braunii]|uniref:Uncharacterized protein n=1 Tax=Chara braunii TaxID=69332 RepID=A0A388KSV4_CHABU|nr:hypothetical protein CBR_g12794 [Chara braunii]|eukprot:GBG73078.1 hypothetical protein CBR_g12794 [Chara braunii]